MTEQHEGSHVVSWAAAANGAVAGAAALVIVSIAIVITQRNVDHFSDTGWPKFFAILLLLGFLLAGWVAGRIAPDAPLTNGLIAGAGAMIIWIPLRILIWLVRDEGKGLISGTDPALPIGSVVLGIGVGAVLGLVGAVVAARLARRSTAAPQDATSDAPPDA